MGFLRQIEKVINAKWVFLVLSSITIVSIFINIIIYNKYSPQLYFGLLVSVIILIFVYKYLFNNNGNLIDDLFPIFLINIIVIFSFYLSRYELSISVNYFRIGFTYTNFSDFFFALLNHADGKYKMASTGYMPFSGFGRVGGAQAST